MNYEHYGTRELIERIHELEAKLAPVKETQPEPGAAHIYVTLQDGTITVYHGDGDHSTVLFTKQAVRGDWDRIWDAIRKDNSGTCNHIFRTYEGSRDKKCMECGFITKEY